MFVGQEKGAGSILVFDKDFSLKFHEALYDFNGGTGSYNNVAENSEGNFIFSGFGSSGRLHTNLNAMEGFATKHDESYQYQQFVGFNSGGLSQAYAAIDNPEGDFIIAGEALNVSGIIFAINPKKPLFHFKRYPFYRNPVSGETVQRVLNVCRTSDDDYFFTGFWSKPDAPWKYGNWSMRAKFKDTFEVIDLFLDSSDFRSSSNGEIWIHMNSTLIPVSDGFMVGSYYSTDGPYKRGMELIKMSHNNQLLWKKHYYGLGMAEFKNMVETDFGYILTGSTFDPNTGSFVKQKAYTLAVDKSGNRIWDHAFGSDDQMTVAHTAKQYPDHIRVAGTFQDSGGSIGFIQYKLDNSGKLIEDLN